MMAFGEDEEKQLLNGADIEMKDLKQYEIFNILEDEFDQQDNFMHREATIAS
jgi:hypothetical protein